MITKLWIKWKIRDFHNSLNSIDLAVEDYSDLVRWNRNFEAFLSQLYPSKSDLKEASSKVLTFAAQSYYKAGDRTQSPTRLDHKSRYRSEFQGILNELRSTVKEHGVPPGFKPPSSLQSMIYLLRAFLFLLVITLPTKCYFEERASAEEAAKEAQANQRDATGEVSDLYRQLSSYDTHFKNISFDSAVNSLRQEIGFESGYYIRYMIEFAEDARRKRDIIIGSALVRLEQLDVASDTLRFSRRLPVRIGQALKGRAKALDLSYDQINAVIRRDSL